MIDVNHQEKKDVEKTIKLIVDSIWVENLSYCFCGSGLKYNECCKTIPLENAWYLDDNLKGVFAELENIASRKSIDEMKIIRRKAATKVYQQLEKHWRLKHCINPSCDKVPIWSHLFPKHFIKNLQWDNYEFNVDGIKKKLGADSFKINLWCDRHDSKLFEWIDEIWDVIKLFDIFSSTENEKSVNEVNININLIWEFFLKTLSFKVKTLILDQMFYFMGLLLPSNDDFRIKLLKIYLENFQVYIQTLNLFDSLFSNSNGNKSIQIPCLAGRRWKVEWFFEPNQIYYQANIKFIWDTPLFVVSIIKDWSRIYFVWTTSLHLSNLKSKEEIEQLYTELYKFKEWKDVMWGIKWIESFFEKNNIYYLNLWDWFHWNTYIYWERKNNKK